MSGIFNGLFGLFKSKPDNEVVAAFWKGDSGTIEKTDNTDEYSELRAWARDLYESQHN